KHYWLLRTVRCLRFARGEDMLRILQPAARARHSDRISSWTPKTFATPQPHSETALPPARWPVTKGHSAFRQLHSNSQAGPVCLRALPMNSPDHAEVHGESAKLKT